MFVCVVASRTSGRFDLDMEKIHKLGSNYEKRGSDMERLTTVEPGFAAGTSVKLTFVCGFVAKRTRLHIASFEDGHLAKVKSASLVRPQLERSPDMDALNTYDQSHHHSHQKDDLYSKLCTPFPFFQDSSLI